MNTPTQSITDQQAAMVEDMYTEYKPDFESMKIKTIPKVIYDKHYKCRVCITCPSFADAIQLKNNLEHSWLPRDYPIIITNGDGG